MEKKIAILTFHRANNYGAVLQSYALCRAIEKLGGSPEIIDYWPKKFRQIYLYEYPFAFRMSYLKAFIKKWALRSILKIRNRGFEEFVQKYLPLSELTYYSPEEIENASLDYSAYLCGSDQVWNCGCSDFDRIFYLDFASAKNKFSYAASFGQTVLPAELIPEYRRRLQGYEFYSVREESGKRLLRELLDVDAGVHCDPTLLVDGEEWGRITNETDVKESYILLYYVNLPDKIQKYAVELAGLTGCRIIGTASNTDWKILSGKNDRPFGIKSFFTASPIEFISLVKNAEYVMTNSFHGTVFSILFQKKFLAETVSGEEVNYRVMELLSSLGISHRRIECTGVEGIFEEIDWNMVNMKLEVMRKNAMDYLEEIYSNV